MKKMNTIEMLSNIKEHQRAKSESLDITVEKDLAIKVIYDGNYQSNVNRALPLSGLVLTTQDWMLEPTQIKDVNEVFNAINSTEGATLLVRETNTIYYFDESNNKTPLDFLNLSQIINGTWFLGFYKTKELECWGYLDGEQ